MMMMTMIVTLLFLLLSILLLGVDGDSTKRAVAFTTTPTNTFRTGSSTSSFTTTKSSSTRSYRYYGFKELRSTAVTTTTSAEYKDDSTNKIITNTITTTDIEDEESKKIEFLKRTSILCNERNIKFDSIKNARDLSSVQHSPIQPNRLLRMGKLSDCSTKDLSMISSIRTIIDLRSPTELKEDINLHRNDVFGNYTTIEWIEGKRSKYISSSGNSKHFHDHIEERGNNVPIKSIRRKLKKLYGGDLVEETCYPGRSCNDSPIRQERHFVSLMNEFKYVRGVVQKLRKRDLFKVLMKSPGALWSKRVRIACKDVFLNKINTGGLPLLNELMSRMGASGIRYTLEVCSDPNRYPIAFHCTAGKDRTGLISAIILSLLGVPDEDIVEDYTLSANVYAQINDHKAMVGALSQRNLNAETFLGAPSYVMKETLESLRDVYGSIENYCDWIGFTKIDREKLIQNLTTTTTNNNNIVTLNKK